MYNIHWNVWTDEKQWKTIIHAGHGRQPTGEDRQATEVVVAVVDVKRTLWLHE